jgi:hypothetical protein
MSNIEPELNIESQENITFREFAKELSTTTKLSLVSIVGGLCVEGASLVMTSVNHMYDSKDPVFAENYITDAKVIGLVAVLGGISTIAARLNHKSKNVRE